MQDNRQVRLTDTALRRSVEGILEPWLETATRAELERVQALLDELLAEREDTERAA